jgi:hypothetical protein
MPAIRVYSHTQVANACGLLMSLIMRRLFHSVILPTSGAYNNLLYFISFSTLYVKLGGFPLDCLTARQAWLKSGFNDRMTRHGEFKRLSRFVKRHKRLSRMRGSPLERKGPRNIPSHATVIAKTICHLEFDPLPGFCKPA